MDEDDGFLTSDAELDSEVEDSEDAELGVWLDQLNAIQQVSGSLGAWTVSRVCVHISGVNLSMKVEGGLVL